MGKIHLTFTPEYEDYLASSKAATYNRPTRILITAMGVISLATVLALMLGWLSPDNERLMFYVLPPGMFIFFLVFTPLNLRRRAVKAAKQAGPVTWCASKKALTFTEEDETTRLSWDLFIEARDIPGYYLIIYKANRADYLFLPKRAFETPAQERQFRALMESQLGEIR
jgi:hypothetical protein